MFPMLLGVTEGFTFPCRVFFRELEVIVTHLIDLDITWPSTVAILT